MECKTPVPSNVDSVHTCAFRVRMGCLAGDGSLEATTESWPDKLEPD